MQVRAYVRIYIRTCFTPLMVQTAYNNKATIYEQVSVLVKLLIKIKQILRFILDFIISIKSRDIVIVITNTDNEQRNDKIMKYKLEITVFMFINFMFINSAILEFENMYIFKELLQTLRHITKLLIFQLFLSFVSFFTSFSFLFLFLSITKINNFFVPPFYFFVMYIPQSDILHSKTLFFEYLNKSVIQDL